MVAMPAKLAQNVEVCSRPHSERLLQDMPVNTGACQIGAMHT